MRSAVIGVGNIGTLHASILSRSGLLCAVCDTDEKKLGVYKDLPVYIDYKKMIDEQKPDSVHICTPHYLHAEMTVYALNRGVNVLCEKPLCISSDQLESVLEAEKRSSAALGVCLQNRYNRETVFVKKYLEGRKTDFATGVVAWHRTAEYYASGEWRGKWATEGGGVLINQALHTLDLLGYLCGTPSYVCSTLGNLSLRGVIEVEDTATVATDRFILFATNSAVTDMPVEISIRAGHDLIKMMPGTVLVNGEAQDIGEEKFIPLGKECYGSGHGALIADFYDRLGKGEKFPIDGAEGASSVRMILAAYKSGGEKVKL